MVKTDLRHSNNTKANKNLHLEMDLWIAFIENNREKILIGTAISKGRIHEHIYTLYYFPNEHCKSLPFLVNYTCGNDWDCARFETIQQAKYYVKKSDWTAKWQRKRK
jgi:hypothetical protein